MNKRIESAINHMVQGLAYWMSYRGEVSGIKVIEADAVFIAADMLRALLHKDFSVEREITKKSSSLAIDGKRIDLGIKDKDNDKYLCFIEFKLADATNGGYKEDAEKLSTIKQCYPDIDCIIVILYRNRWEYNKPQELVGPNGMVNKKTKSITVGNKQIPIRVRRVCNSFPSKSKKTKSRKTICIEVL